MHARENRFWGEDWPEIRKLWPIDPEVAFLNHGSFGATPSAVLNVQRAWMDRLERQPVNFLVRELPEHLDEARRHCAAFLGGDWNNLVFVPNATYAVNHVVRSLPIEAGDEILVTDQVYPAVHHTMKRVCENAGARLILQPVPLPEREDDQARMAEAFLDGLTSKTKFVVIDHVASPTGLIMPIETIVRECRRRNIWCMVDAAHAPGMLDVNLRELDPDFWTGNFHKWCCAPKVSGGLYVRPEFQSIIKPIITSVHDGLGYAKEFSWVGTHDPTPFLATPAAIDFLSAFGWDRIRAHNHELVRFGRQVISERLHTQPPVFDSPTFYGSMTVVAIPDSAPFRTIEQTEAFRAAFYRETKIEATFLVWRERRWIRLSAQIYNAPAEYETLAEALAARLHI